MAVENKARLTPQLVISIIALFSGGLSGVVFKIWWDSRPTEVTYSTTSSTLGTDPRVKTLLPDVKIQIGKQELSAVHIHTVEFRTISGPFADAAQVAIVFPPTVSLFNRPVVETSSPLHKMICSTVDHGATCEIKPLLKGNGLFRVSFAATGSSDGPNVTMAARAIELRRADAQSTRDAVFALVVWAFAFFIAGGLVGTLYGYLFSLTKQNAQLAETAAVLENLQKTSEASLATVEDMKKEIERRRSSMELRHKPESESKS